MTTNKKILVVVNGPLFYRNYLTSRALEEIRDNCVFLVNKKLADRPFNNIPKDRIHFFEYPASKEKLCLHLFNINTKKFRHLSKTFGFRYSLLRHKIRRRWLLLYNILTLPLIYQISKFVISALTFDSNLSKQINNLKPDLILLPSTGYEGLTFEIIKIAKKSKFKSCLLVDNWDNLSSKTIFTIKPDYVTVWGQQSVEHAQTIHKIPKDRIFILGTPRFQDYFKFREQHLGSPYGFKYAVFAGNALPFDELTALHKLDEIIDKNKYPITIIYRPHPARQGRKCLDTFFEYDFKNIKLDVPAKAYYKKMEQEEALECAGLDYYPRLLDNMEFMICPLSTMIVEGLIFNKMVFALTYDDKTHPANPYFAFQNYLHFVGIGDLQNIRLIDDLNKFEQIFKIAEQPVVSGYDPKLNYYICKDTRDYSANLARAVEKMIIS